MINIKIKKAESDTKELIIKIILWVLFLILLGSALTSVLKKLGVW